MGRKYIQTIVGLVLALMCLAAVGCSDQSGSAENDGEVKWTRKVEKIEGDELETDPYFYLIEGEWVVVEYAGSRSDRLAQEYYTEEYWEQRENTINMCIEEHLGREYRMEPDNLVSVYTLCDGTAIIQDDAALSSATVFFHPEIMLEAPYIGLNVIFRDDIDDVYSVIIDNKGIVLIDVGPCFFRLERKTETNMVESGNGEEERNLYFGGEEYFTIAEGEWIVGEYLCGEYVYGGISEERTDEIIEEYSGQKLRIERDNLGYFGPAFGRIFYPEDMEQILTSSMEVQDLSPMEGWYIRAKVYLFDRDEWYYFIFDSTGKGIVQIQGRFFWLERQQADE